jgi:hypothetical protein
MREPTTGSIVATPFHIVSTHRATGTTPRRLNTLLRLLWIIIPSSTIILSWSTIMKKLAPVSETTLSVLEAPALLGHLATTSKTTSSKVSWALP